MINDSIFKEVLQTALSGKHREFNFLRNLTHLSNALEVRSGIKAINKTLKRLFKLMYKLYIAQVKENKQDINVVISLQQIIICIAYYKEELVIVNDMIHEYRAYVFGGHFLDTLLGKTRAEIDLVDYRKLPWKIF